MNENLYGYDKLLTKDEFYLDVIYPNIVKSAGIYFYNFEYKTARDAGNTIEDVISQTFYYAYKPYAKGGFNLNKGETIYDYYVKNFFDVRAGNFVPSKEYVRDANGNKVKDENGKYVREVVMKLAKPCLATIRTYINMFVRNVLTDMCKLAENKKELISFETPIGGDEDGRTIGDTISDMEDPITSMDTSLYAFHCSIDEDYIQGSRGPVRVLDIVNSLENGDTIKDVCEMYNLTSFDILDYFNSKSDLFRDCFSSVTEDSLSKLGRRVNNAKRGRKDRDNTYEPPRHSKSEMLGNNG